MFFLQACMRSCVGDAQIADCGCADVHFALDDKPVCNTVENSATGDYEILQLMRQRRIFCFLNMTMSTKKHLFYTRPSYYAHNRLWQTLFLLLLFCFFVLVFCIHQDLIGS